MTDRKHVYIAMPTFTGKPKIETHFCLMDLQEGLRKMGWTANWKFTVRDSMIFRTRNLFAADFYENKEYTDLIMLDDDLWWEPDAVLRLLSHPYDLVAGAYPKRQPTLEFPVKTLNNPLIMPDDNGVLEVDKVPTGFIRFTRYCIEKMIKHFDEELSYTEGLLPSGKAWALFWFDLVKQADGSKQLMGEDFTFCRRWREIGGKVHLDTLLRFKHFGEAAYEGCFAEHIPWYKDQLPRDTLAAAE